MSETLSLRAIEYCDRMLDCARGIHSLPESAAVADEQQEVYGPDWNRAICDCKLYVYPHSGCPGKVAKHLPREEGQ